MKVSLRPSIYIAYVLARVCLTRGTKLSACIYGEGSHFVTIVRDFSNNRLLYCDGMENNAQFVEYKATREGLFPVTLSRKEMQTAFYMRSEFANIVTK